MCQAGDPGDVREFRSSLTECLFRKPTLSYVLNRADIFKSTILVSCRVADQVEVLHRTIRHQQPMIVLEVACRRLVLAQSCRPSMACRQGGHGRRSAPSVTGLGGVKLEDAIDLLRPCDFPGATFQEKVPVRLRRWPSTRNALLRRNSLSVAIYRSVMSRR